MQGHQVQAHQMQAHLPHQVHHVNRQGHLKKNVVL
jgi:hypothetical protein